MSSNNDLDNRTDSPNKTHDAPSNWEPAPDRAKAVADTPDRARGWINTVTEEVIIRQPLIESGSDLPAYGVYFYLDVSLPSGLGTNRSLLFRDDDADRVDERVTAWLDSVSTPTDPDRFDTAVDPVTVRRNELSHVTSLEDWAHYTGAKYYLGEKIGNRKQSGGSVALFDGSTRRGEGAYVALAAENGPRGKEYASVGYQPAGHYTTDQPLTRNAFEITSPTVTFDRGVITISSADTSKEITVTAQRNQPNHNLNNGDNA